MLGLGVCIEGSTDWRAVHKSLCVDHPRHVSATNPVGLRTKNLRLALIATFPHNDESADHRRHVRIFPCYFRGVGRMRRSIIRLYNVFID